ncbi:MAG: hypothetical protein JXB07_20265 [Anaerolineae bacterium]|nr:hypothetical protein [Anaerolineae bacterium]
MPTGSDSKLEDSDLAQLPVLVANVEDEPSILPIEARKDTVVLSPASMTLCKQDDPKVYLVIYKERRHIVDWETFLALGFKREQIIPCGTMADYVEGSPLTVLLKGSSDPVYWMEGGLRRYIPDMETFFTLGYRQEDIAQVPDDLLEAWPLGSPLASQRATTAPATQTDTSLVAALRSIHDRFEIDPSRGCWNEILTPYPEYHKGLQEMTALLLTDPRAQSISLTGREALFAEVAGFDGVKFIPGDGSAKLVSIKSYRDRNDVCGHRFGTPHSLHVVDAQGTIHNIPAWESGDPPLVGILLQTWWIGDRWVTLSRLRIDSVSGPMPWGLTHIGRKASVWQPLIMFEFDPIPYDFDPPSIRFEDGYNAMIADLTYWYADDPCEFTQEFKDTYAHDSWQMRRTYQLVDNIYQQVSSEMLSFTIYRKDTHEVVDLEWQDYCTGPVK